MRLTSLLPMSRVRAERGRAFQVDPSVCWRGARAAPRRRRATR